MFGSRPPQKSRRGKFWDWLNPALGKSVNGWIAGPVVGVETHYLGRTQPCRYALTRGRMKCYCTASKLESVWKGYVPLWDENGVQAFAIIGERFADLAYAITMFAPVTVSRLKSAGQPICVKQSDWTDQPPPRRDLTQSKPVDFRPWLLKLWADKDLNAWLEAHPEILDQEQPAGELENRVGPMLKAAARRAEQSQLPDSIGDVLGSIPHAGRNGKAHK